MHIYGQSLKERPIVKEEPHEEAQRERLKVEKLNPHHVYHVRKPRLLGDDLFFEGVEQNLPVIIRATV